MIKELTNENFETEVLKNEKKVLVDFNAEWCGPCQMLAPIIKEFAAENEDVKVVSANIDECDEIAAKYKVISIPCLVVFENGEEKAREIGILSKKKIKKLLEKN